eukprot:12547671-Ditylum_brightwellii.AAC.1
MAKKPTSAYVTPYKALKKYTNQKRANKNLPMDVVSEMPHCSPQHCRQFVSGLQWHANFREHIGENFIVDSSVVKSALKQQK